MRLGGNLIYGVIAILVILILIFGWQAEKEVKTIEEGAGAIESVGSGFLEIETMPSDAEIFLDDAYSGKSPLELYNIPAGIHNIIIKKDGYEDFAKDVIIEAGKKTFLESNLVPMPGEEEVEAVESAEEEEDITEIIRVEEEVLRETPKINNTINIGKGFLLYYDFSERDFTNNRQFDEDVFSKRFDKYIVFTRYNPANIKTINKNINDIGKEDCIGIKGEFEYLRSGQSLCIITRENQIVTVGGYWENTENAELKWKVFI